MPANPFEEIERAFDRMSEQFGVLDEDLFVGAVRVDVADPGEEFVVTADLPGYDRETVDVELAGQTLTISAIREAAEAAEAGPDETTYVRRERRHESVSRSIRLPEAVEADATDAAYENGVLTVTLPKATTEDGHSIPID
jgi:HSP20 family protein